VITIGRVRQTIAAEAAYSRRVVDDAAKLGERDEYARGRASGLSLALRMLAELDEDDR